jgi:hypothetical protein
MAVLGRFSRPLPGPVPMGDFDISGLAAIDLDTAFGIGA